MQLAPLSVGRREELALLDAHLAEARDGHGGVVALVGEAGIGKSALTRAFASRAAATGAVVARGHCHEAEWSRGAARWNNPESILGRSRCPRSESYIEDVETAKSGAAGAAAVDRGGRLAALSSIRASAADRYPLLDGRENALRKSKRPSCPSMRRTESPRIIDQTPSVIGLHVAWITEATARFAP
jgi:hypothetical protein